MYTSIVMFVGIVFFGIVIIIFLLYNSISIISGYTYYQ